MKKWWPQGPRRPALSDKLADWNVMPLVGGEDFIRGHDVLDIGPEYGLDAIMFAHLARRYVIVDDAEDVCMWISSLRSGGLIYQGAQIEMVDACNLPFEDEFDLVLDFGTIDNTGNNLAAYDSAVKALRHHGTLVTTYANRNILTNEYSDDKSEQRIFPEALAKFLYNDGMWVRNRFREDQARAVMIAQKGWEPYDGCQWVKTHTCTCTRPSSL